MLDEVVAFLSSVLCDSGAQKLADVLGGRLVVRACVRRPRSCTVRRSGAARVLWETGNRLGLLRRVMLDLPGARAAAEGAFKPPFARRAFHEESTRFPRSTLPPS